MVEAATTAGVSQSVAIRRSYSVYSISYDIILVSIRRNLSRANASGMLGVLLG